MKWKAIMILWIFIILLFSGIIFSSRIIPSGEEQEDTSTIAFVSKRDGNEEIYLMSSDGSDQHRLTSTPKDEERPMWSPDGSRIAYVLRQERWNCDLWLMDADGGNVTRLTTHNAEDTRPDWH